MCVFGSFDIFALAFLLHWGALSTYWKKKGADAVGYNWLAHGVGIGVAAFPFVWFGVSLKLLLIRALTLGVLTMVWSEGNDNAVWEECGRGALIVLTLPILFIG